PFPPASAYRLNRCLFALKSDAAFRQSFQQDATRAMTEAGLSDQEQQLVLARDRDALVAAGAHPYLVFMADLRLRMDRSAFEHFSHERRRGPAGPPPPPPHRAIRDDAGRLRAHVPRWACWDQPRARFLLGQPPDSSDGRFVGQCELGQREMV